MRGSRSIPAAVLLLSVAACNRAGTERSYAVVGDSVATVRAAFNADAGKVRVLMVVSPTCGACLDPTARRISQALDVTPGGLSRVQIRALFHRHVSKERIDLALEQLLTLGLIYNQTAAGRGRSANLWAKVQNAATGTNTTETDPYGA